MLHDLTSKMFIRFLFFCVCMYVYMVTYVAWHTHVEVRGRIGDSVFFSHNVGLLGRTPDWTQAWWWQVSLPVGPPPWPMCSSGWQQTPYPPASASSTCLNWCTPPQLIGLLLWFFFFFCLFSFVFGRKNKFLKVKESCLVAPESSSCLRKGPPYRGLWAFRQWGWSLSCACPETLALVRVGKRN